MSPLRHTYHSSVYRNFRAIPPSDQREIIHFFEKHEKAIRQSYPEEFFEMLALYGEALFDTNHFRKFTVVADEIIFRSIEQNIVTFKGQDVYRHMLYLKARAHLKCLETDEAEHILRELLRMAPADQSYLRLLRRACYIRKPNWVRQARAMAVLLFLISALVTALEVLFITPFTPEWTTDVQLVRNSLFGLGWLFLISSDLLLRIRIQREVRAFVASVRSGKGE